MSFWKKAGTPMWRGGMEACLWWCAWCLWSTLITFTILLTDSIGISEVGQVITVDKGHQAHHQEPRTPIPPLHMGSLYQFLIFSMTKFQVWFVRYAFTRRRRPQRGGAGWKPAPDGVPGAPCQSWSPSPLYPHHESLLPQLCPYSLEIRS